MAKDQITPKDQIRINTLAKEEAVIRAQIGREMQKEKIDSTEDIAQLRANVALDRTHNSPQRGE